MRPDLFAGFGIFLDIARLTVRLQRGLPVRILFKRFADMGKPGLFFTIFFLAGTFLPLPAAGIDGYPPPLAEEAGVGGGDTGRKEIFRLILQNPAYAVPDKLRALDSLLWLSPKDGRQVLALLDQKARLLEREGDYPRAREAYRSALAFWEQEFPEDEAAGGELRYNEARLAFYEGDYEESSNLLYRILEDTRNAALRARAHSLLAMVLINAGQIPLAEDHIFRAQRIVDSVEVDTGTLFAVSNHKAALLYEQGCYSEVLEEMKRVERYAISLGKADYLSIHNQNMALLYMKTGQRELARELLRNIAEAYRKENAISHQHVLVLQNLAEISMEEGDYVHALSYYREALDLARKGNMLHNQSSILMNISTLYAQEHRYRSAWEYLMEGTALKDSVVDLQLKDKMLETNLEFKRKEAQLREQILQSEYLQAKLENRNYALFFALSCFALLLSGVLLHRYRAKLKAKEQDNNLLHQALGNMEAHFYESTEELSKKFKEDIDSKGMELTRISLMLAYQNSTLEFFGNSLKKLNALNSYAACKPVLKEMEAMLRVHDSDSVWREFNLYFEKLHPGFFDKLHARYPGLTPNEERTCALLYMNMNTKEIASITHRSVRTVEAVIHQIRKKMGIPDRERTQGFLLRDLSDNSGQAGVSRSDL